MIRLASFFFLFCITGVTGLYLFMQNYQQQKVVNIEDITFKIEQGESLYSVGRKLEEQGVVDSAFVFVKMGSLKAIKIFVLVST